MDDYSSKILEALAEVDKLTRAGIVAELELLRPSYELALEEAAAKLTAAYAALDLPSAQISELDAIILNFQERSAEHQALLDDPDPHNRIVARFMFQGFCEEIGKLADKRHELRENLKLLKEDHESARDAEIAAEGELSLFEMNLKQPYLHLGQQTETYKAFRVGSWGQWVGMLSGKLTWEKDAFFHGLDEIAVNTEYRTDKLTERIRQHEIQQALEDNQRNFPNAGDKGAPTGADIRREIHSMMENQWADQSVSKIEDLRQVKIPVAQRDYMSAPHVATTARKM